MIELIVADNWIDRFFIQAGFGFIPAPLSRTIVIRLSGVLQYRKENQFIEIINLNNNAIIRMGVYKLNAPLIVSKRNKLIESYTNT